MRAATSSKCSTSAFSARPRFAHPRSNSWWRRAIASTPKPWCARFRKKESGFRCPDAGGVCVAFVGGVFVALLQLFVSHAELRFLGLVQATAEAGFRSLHNAIHAAFVV